MVAVSILASFGLLAYQGLVAKDLEEKNVIRALLILAGLVLALLKTGRCPRVTNKKAVYEKAYPEYIQNVFSADKKLETLFFRAVDDYNQNNPSAGVKKLEALRKECHSTMDLYAVTVFTALWSLLFVIPGIMASYSYAMAPFIMAENPDISANDAIKASKEMMQGNRLELFSLDLTFIGWNLLALVTLGISTLFVTPYHNQAHAVFYEDLRRKTPVINN